MKPSKRTLASRANGAKSRGPKTEAGKLRSSMNAVRHGLLAKCVLLQNESPEHFQTLCQQFIDKLNPADDVELACVEEMIAATWRLRRVMAIETNLLDNAIGKRTEEDEMSALSAAFSQLSAGPELHLVDRYETRLHRLYRRSFNNFLLLREMRPPAPNEPNSAQPPKESTPCPAGNSSACRVVAGAFDLPTATDEPSAHGNNPPAGPSPQPQS